MISFLGMSTRSSGKIRGQQVSDVFGCSFFDYSRVPIERLEKTVILIRNQNNQFARFLKSREHIVGYDLLDMPVGDLIFRDTPVNFSTYVDPGIDFYIVNNSYQKAELEKHTEKNIFIIPHHTPNFEDERSCKGDKLKRVSYIGLPSQLDRIDDIGDFCKSLGLEFSVHNPKTREECISCLKNTDLGLVYLGKENKWYDEIVKQKPNTKLTNFQSFGIPTICTKYNSFSEFGGNACIFIDSFEDLKNAIKLMVDDEDLRQELSDRAYQNGQNYHIEKIAQLYKKISI